jgi:hypothetical protein
MGVFHRGPARIVGVAVAVTLAGLAASHALGRVYWNPVVFALNRWYTPYDLGVFLPGGSRRSLRE